VRALDHPSLGDALSFAEEDRVPQPQVGHRRANRGGIRTRWRLHDRILGHELALTIQLTAIPHGLEVTVNEIDVLVHRHTAPTRRAKRSG
jgi:hypothetical protein